jgi:clan AA aspartic protease
MGLTHVTVKVGNPADGRRTEEVRCLVDSGAVYSLVPGRVLRRLGIKPHSTREFLLADGEVIRRRLATATVEYAGRRGDSMVLVGESGDDPLLGATTIEGFGLVLNPFRRELRPMQLPLKRCDVRPPPLIARNPRQQAPAARARGAIGSE